MLQPLRRVFTVHGSAPISSQALQWFARHPPTRTGRVRGTRPSCPAPASAPTLGFSCGALCICRGLGGFPKKGPVIRGLGQVRGLALLRLALWRRLLLLPFGMKSGLLLTTLHFPGGGGLSKGNYRVQKGLLSPPLSFFDYLPR